MDSNNFNQEVAKYVFELAKQIKITKEQLSSLMNDADFVGSIIRNRCEEFEQDNESNELYELAAHLEDSLFDLENELESIDVRGLLKRSNMACARLHSKLAE